MTLEGVTAGDDLPSDELAGLRQFLQRQRELVVWKLRDCPADVLQAVSTPSGMTALGIVRHLGEVERNVRPQLGRGATVRGRLAGIPQQTGSACMAAVRDQVCGDVTGLLDGGHR